MVGSCCDVPRLSQLRSPRCDRQRPASAVGSRHTTRRGTNLVLCDCHVVGDRLEPLDDRSLEGVFEEMMGRGESDAPNTNIAGRYIGDFQRTGFIDVARAPEAMGSAESKSRPVLSLPLAMSKSKLCVDQRSGQAFLAVTVLVYTTGGHQQEHSQREGDQSGKCEQQSWIFFGTQSEAFESMHHLKMGGSISGQLNSMWDLSEEVLGTGAFTEVRKAMCNPSKASSAPASEVAVKILKISEKVDMASLQNEVAILAAVQKHPNVIAFYGLFTIADDVWALTMTCCTNDDLYAKVATKAFDENESFRILTGVLRALEHIHRAGIVHRDVKAENILLDSHTSQPMLTDFGISHLESDRTAMSKRRGSPGYIAPEMILSNFHICSYKLDVFSCGVLLYFCASGHLPFSSGSLSSIFKKTVVCKIRFDKPGRLEETTQSFKWCVVWLCEAHPAYRPSANEALTYLERHSERQTIKSNGGEEFCFYERGRASFETVQKTNDVSTTGRNAIPIAVPLGNPKKQSFRKRNMRVKAPSADRDSGSGSIGFKDLRTTRESTPRTTFGSSYECSGDSLFSSGLPANPSDDGDNTRKAFVFGSEVAMVSDDDRPTLDYFARSSVAASDVAHTEHKPFWFGKTDAKDGKVTDDEVISDTEDRPTYGSFSFDRKEYSPYRFVNRSTISDDEQTDGGQVEDRSTLKQIEDRLTLHSDASDQGERKCFQSGCRYSLRSPRRGDMCLSPQRHRGASKMSNASTDAINSDRHTDQSTNRSFSSGLSTKASKFRSGMFLKRTKDPTLSS